MYQNPEELKIISKGTNITETKIQKAFKADFPKITPEYTNGRNNSEDQKIIKKMLKKISRIKTPQKALLINGKIRKSCPFIELETASLIKWVEVCHTISDLNQIATIHSINIHNKDDEQIYQGALFESNSYYIAIKHAIIRKIVEIWKENQKWFK